MTIEYTIIELSKTGINAGKYFAIVDECDADLADLNWSILLTKDKKPRYAVRKYGIFLHRIILGRILYRDLLSSEEVDHIDGNGLNCIRSNLRLATHAQNMQNQGKYANNTSGFKGVSWNKQHQKWVASIQINNKPIHLGLFITKELAYEAYCKAADKFHQDFANYKEQE